MPWLSFRFLRKALTKQIKKVAAEAQYDHYCQTDWAGQSGSSPSSLKRLALLDDQQLFLSPAEIVIELPPGYHDQFVVQDLVNALRQRGFTDQQVGSYALRLA